MSCLLACAFVANPAHAAPAFSASASIEGLSYRLIDLDLDDGIAPTITFHAASFPQQTSLQVGEGGFISHGVKFSNGDSVVLTGSPLDSTSGQISLPSGLASASMANGKLSLAAHASASEMTDRLTVAGIQSHNLDWDTTALYGVRGGADTVSGPYQPGQAYFELSANTQLVVEGVFNTATMIDGDSLLGTSVDDAARQLGKEFSLTAYASATVKLSTFDAVGEDRTYRVADVASVYSSRRAYLNQHGTEVVDQGNPDLVNSSFSVVYSNEGDLPKFGRLAQDASASGMVTLVPWRVPVPIPEPSTWVLMGLGLALMGCGVARHRRPLA